VGRVYRLTLSNDALFLGSKWTGIQAWEARCGVVLILGGICIRGNPSYIKLQYLRSRWYSTEQGRFISRDTWQGDYIRPASYNKWLYGYANPIRFVDPSGMISCEDNNDSECIAALTELKLKANEIKQSVEAGTLMPVEGYAELVDEAMRSFDLDLRGMVWGVTHLLNGYDANSN